MSKRKVLRVATLLSLTCSNCGVAVSTSCAGDLFSGKTRRPACCNGWKTSAYASYRSLSTSATASVNLVAVQGQPATTRELALDEETPELQSRIVRITKNFFPEPPQTQIAAGNVTLDRFGAMLFADGRHVLTGRIAFDGGPDKKYHGANVEVVTRLYAGTPRNPTAISTEALLFEASRHIWIPKDESMSLSLLPVKDPVVPSIPVQRPLRNGFEVHVQDRGANADLNELIRLYFDQITVIEVELKYMHAR